MSSIPGPDEELRMKAVIMMGKLRKYWNPFRVGNDRDNYEMNKILIVASVFDPRRKMTFAKLCFEKLYGKESLEYNLLYDSIMDILKRLFDEYSGFVNNGSGGCSGTSSQGASSSHSQDQMSGQVFESRVLGNGIGYERMDSLYDELLQETGTQSSTNELELYLKEGVENPKLMKGQEYDVLSWWMRNSPKFHVLSLIAKDILALQVSSVASESAFSTSGRVLNPHRSCLTNYMIEVLMCTEQWLKCEIHINEKGDLTIEQLLSDVEMQDDLMREFVPDFNLQGSQGL